MTIIAYTKHRDKEHQDRVMDYAFEHGYYFSNNQKEDYRIYAEGYYYAVFMRENFEGRKTLSYQNFLNIDRMMKYITKEPAKLINCDKNKQIDIE